jgi:hypothetical protein
MAGAVTLRWGTSNGRTGAEKPPMAVALRCGICWVGAGVLDALCTEGLNAL